VVVDVSQQLANSQAAQDWQAGQFSTEEQSEIQKIPYTSVTFPAMPAILELT
jgi:hypothetical protein